MFSPRVFVAFARKIMYNNRCSCESRLMVWRQLPKLIPAGSIPVSRDKKPRGDTKLSPLGFWREREANHTRYIIWVERTAFPRVASGRGQDLRPAEGSPTGVSADSRFSLLFLRTTRDEKSGRKVCSPRVSHRAEGETCALPRGPLQGMGQSFSRPKNMPQAA